MDRTTQVVRQALDKTPAADLLAVELVGGGVRVPAIDQGSYQGCAGRGGSAPANYP